jgi:hypothetical protein
LAQLALFCSKRKNKSNFLAELALFCSKSKEPFLLIGDFKVIRFPSEKIKVDKLHRHLKLSMLLSMLMN